MEFPVKTVTVYASSSSSIHAEFLDHARQLGVLIAKEGWVQVNGGGRTGLMGAATEGGLSAGGIVDAVILDMFTSTNMHPDLRNIVVEKTMTDRKKGLYDRGDAFIVLPGGLGTLEEMSEILAWRQLNIHERPITLVNTRGFYNHFQAFINYSIAEGFIAKEFQSVFTVSETPEEAVKFIKDYRRKHIEKERIWSGNMGDKREDVASDWSAAAAARAQRGGDP
eukprot:Plantae.Rhodophyta-Purpureofilum_apyrenoidigerum.ctg23648.p1 GENE.Plantae.Rhodophyta-Purpureofilum_apyrenoidigerum.ctg23648~~Plantae.Rhodophyta-Purpureofilum_apyrenoidigerum.ctg23648.p1  ORF type:complete len:223 (-),score=46.60 Plantae.Rhodophyta-Purpureofilum_apyrenoidigerum.ctg23648:333-1001(-)